MPKHKHHSRTRSKDEIDARNANSLFKPDKSEIKERDCTQSVNVTVNVDQKDDGCTGCFKALVGAFKKG